MKLVPLTLLIAIMMTVMIAGCTSSSDEPSPEEKAIQHLYEEKELNIDQSTELLSVQKSTDNSYVSARLDSTTNTIRFSHADASLKETSVIGNDLQRLISPYNALEIPDVYGQYGVGPVVVFTVDAGGNLYVLEHEIIKVNEMPSFDGAQALFVYNPDGKFQRKLPIAKPAQIKYFVPHKLSIQENKYMIVSDNGIIVLDQDGNLLTEFNVPFIKALDLIHNDEQLLPGGSIVDAVWMGDQTIGLIQYKSSEEQYYLVAYRVDKNETIWSAELEYGFRPSTLLYEGKEARLYAASGRQMLAYTNNGEPIESRIQFDQYSSGAYMSSAIQGNLQMLTPRAIQLDQQNQLTLFMGDTMTVKRAYTYRELLGEEKDSKLAELAELDKQKTVIKLTAPYKTPNFESVIAKYEHDNPQVKVAVSYFRDKDEEFNIGDYGSYVNTSILSGDQSWDVLSTQYLSYQTLVEKKTFAELATISDPIWRSVEEQYLPNILEASTIGGNHYILPARISMYAVMANRQAAESINQRTYSWNNLIDASKTFSYTSNQKPWVFQGPGYNFNVVFESVFNSLEPSLRTDAANKDAQRKQLEQFLDIMKQLSDENDYANPPEDEAVFLVSAFDTQIFKQSLDQLDSTKQMLGAPTSSDSKKHAFTVQEGYGINRNSKHREEALKLIMYLAKHAEQDNIMFKDTYAKLEQLDDMTESKKQVIQSLQSIVEQLNVIHDLGSTIIDALYDTTKQYIEGMTDRQTAVQTILDKLWLYENE